MRRLICYGDSNTYGYDPRGYLGGRYPEEVRWINRLGFEGETVNLGLNGRTIPHDAGSIERAVMNISANVNPEDENCLWIMLGTNDLTSMNNPSADEAADRMRGLLAALMEQEPWKSNPQNVLIITPPDMHEGYFVYDDRTPAESLRLGETYSKAAEEFGVRCADLTGHDIPIAPDGVHLTEEGNAVLAKLLREYI